MQVTDMTASELSIMLPGRISKMTPDPGSFIKSKFLRAFSC